MMQPMSKKSKYVPEVRMVRGQPGRYLVTSEKYTYVQYAVDVPANTCECEACFCLSSCAYFNSLKLDFFIIIGIGWVGR